MKPITYMEQSSDKTKMIIVRNPWGRLVSAYRNKLIDGNWKLQVSIIVQQLSEKSHLFFIIIIICLVPGLP